METCIAEFAAVIASVHEVVLAGHSYVHLMRPLVVQKDDVPSSEVEESVVDLELHCNNHTLLIHSINLGR